jgi:hypothetical protein
MTISMLSATPLARALSPGNTASIATRGACLWAICAILPPSGFALALRDDPPIKAYKEEYHPSFKNNPQEVKGLKIFATDPERVTYKEDALRITLPVGTSPPRTGDGVATDFGLKGDFDITVRFEVKGQGGITRYPTGLKLVIVPSEPAERGGVWHKSSQNGASLSRELRHVESAAGFAANVTRWTPPTRSMGESALTDKEPTPAGNDRFGRPDFSSRETQSIERKAAAADSGRMRLVRSGETLFFYGSDGDNAAFELISSQPFGAKDLQNVRILASTGGAGAALDVLVTDLVIRADAFPKSPDLPFDVDVNIQDAAQPLSNREIVLWSAVPLAALALVLGVWRGRARGRAARTTQAAPTGPTMIEFFCTACGTRLRVKAELGGKNVKCPKCAAHAPVPEEEPKEEKLP